MSIFDEYRKKNRKEEEEGSVDSSLASFRDQNDRTKSLFQDKGYAEVTSNARSQINTSDSIRKFRENNIAQRDYEIAEREYMASLPNDAYRDAYTRSKENGGVYVSPYLAKGIEGKEKLKYNNDNWNKLPEATKKKYLEWAQQELETQSKKDIPNLNRTNEALDYAMAIVNETDRYITKVGDMDVQGTYNNKNTFDPDQELQIMYQWMPEEVRDYLYDGMVHIKSEDQELNTQEKIEKYLSDNYPEYVIEDLRKYASQAHNAESMYGLMSTADRLLEESPAYATAGSTLQRLATDVVVKPIAGGITLWNKMNGIDDPYATEIQRYAALSDYIGGEVARDAYVPTDAPVFAGKNLSGVYNTSYSIAENVTRMAMAKSIGIGASQVPGLKLSDEVRAAIAKTVASATDLSIVSSGVFNDEYRNAILEGVDPGAATIRAIGHAINESLFEEWSLDKLKIFDAKYVVGSKSGFVKQLLKGAFVEGSEEFATEYANQMFDTLFTYDYSDFKAFKDALDQKTGETHSELEAFGLFQKQVMMQAGEAFIGGALSGLVLGATGNYDAYVRGQYYNDYAKNISDTEYQRMLPTVEAMAQAFPKMAEKLEYARQAGGDVMKGVVGEFVSAMNEDIRKSIQQSKTVEDLNTLMDNSLLTTNGVLTQDTINAYNAKLTELGKTPTAEYDTFVRNRDIGASDSIEGLMMPRSETTRNVIKAENEYVTAMYDAEQENTAKNVRRVKETRENLEKQTEFAEDMVARYAVIGKSLDSPELKQYVDALGLERVAKIYSDAKIAAQAETITPVKKNGVVKFADENELHSVLGKDSVGHISALTMNEIRANKDYYATYSYATILGRLTGTNYAFFKSDRTDKQKNGAYDPKTNTAYIDMEAGKSGTARATGGAFSHEFVHEARAKNESLYQGLKEFVKDDLGDSWNDFVKERVDRFKLSEDVAEEEVVAEACQRMLENSEVFKKYAIADYNGAKTLRTRLVEFLNRLRRMIKSVFKGNIDTNVTQAISDLEGLQKEFDHVLEEVIKMPSADEMTKEEAVKQDAMEHGYDFESADDAVYRHSARFTLSDEQIEEYSKQMSEQLGCTVDEAKEYFKAADSLSSFVLDPLYNKYLDYDPDGRYTAIKKNADYPQGTVDFTNNCRKRTIFTNVFDRLQKAMPNRIFNAVTLADLRETLKKFGYKVACALCFVEDRRQRMGEIGDLYVKALTNSHKNHNDVLMYTNSKKQSYPLLMTQTLKDRYGDRVPFQPGEEIVIKDSYVPTQYDIVTYEGFAKLTEEHPTVALGFEAYNNRRGMSSARLIEGRGEYKREILKYTPEQVKRINDLGGLRIFSFSDFEVVHLLDLCQVITDCATVGLKIQTYTKVPAFAKLIRNTNIKCNRSLIPKGKGWDVDAKGNKYLVYDTTEGIDINDPDFFDSTDSENIGNILVGINKEQIRLAMVDDFVDYIIPFHTNQAKKVLVKKGISLWDNYKKFQTDKTASGSPTMVNIYTEVLDKYNPQNKYQFVDAFLRECKNRKITPRFEEFIDKENGQYKTVTIDGQTYMYTPGYEKFLVDFKLFDKEGNILPQKEVFPSIDMEYAKNLMKAEVENAKEQDKVDDAVVNELIEKYKDKNVKFSQRNTEYMNAIGRGDQETADRLVYETAKERGFTKKLYHGTNAFGFTIVDNDAPGADGFSFWAADTEAMSSTYTKIGRVRNISQNMSDEEVEELREELYNEKSDVMDEDIEKFCRLIAEHFSEWFLGYDGASYVRKVVDDASAEMGNGDGVYDKLVDMVGEAYDQYGENFQEEYGEFYEWQEDSEAWEEIENAIIGIEGDKTALDEIENGDMEGGIYQLYANTDNMYELDGKGALWNNLRPEGLPDIGRPYKTRDVAKWARDNGYDGVIFHNIYDNGQYGRTPLGDVYAFFKPHSQVKSADTVTYDDNGEIIPLDLRFKTKWGEMEMPDIRYSSRDSERDSEYMSAVNSGDMNTAQRLVDEAAKEAGYTIKAYHGTNGGEFNTFEWDKTQRADGGWYGRGHYFTPYKGMAKEYGKRIIDAYLKITKPFNFNKEVYSLDGTEVKGVMPHAVSFVINMSEKFPSLFADRVLRVRDNKTYGVKEIKWSDVRDELNEVEDNMELVEFGDGKFKWKYVVDEKFFSEAWSSEYYDSKEDAEKGKLEDAMTILMAGKYEWNNAPMSPEAYYLSGDGYTSNLFSEELKKQGYDGVLQADDGDEIVVFDSSQIKSADPVTYDDNGNVIPLSERFNKKNEDIRYSERGNDALDKEYFSAVESGNKEEQRKIVEEFARRAGYNSPILYHGTSGFGFTVIDAKKSNDRISFFATDSEETAGSYSGTKAAREIGSDSDSNMGIYQLYANTDGMLEFDANGMESNHIALGNLASDYNYMMNTKSWSAFATAKQLAKYAKAKGATGVVIRNVIDSANPESRKNLPASDVYVFLNPTEQVKSADLVTRDEDGNIIPPSERFNRESDDIRFSARDLANSESEMIVNAMTNDAALVDNLGAKQSVTAYAKAYNELQAMEKQSVQYSKELAKASPSEREALYKKLLRLNRAITNKTTELTEMRSQRVLRDVLINEWGKRLDDVAWTNELTYLRTKDALEKKYGGEIKTLKIKSKEQQQAIRNRYEINKRKKNIEKKTKELMNRILHPTEKKHIPSILVNPIVEMLDSIDYWTPAEDRMVTKKSETLKTRFLNFKAAMDEYQKQVNKGAELTEYMFDQDFIDEVQELCNSVRDIKNVNDMTVDEITDLDHILTTLNHLIKRGNDMVVQSHFKTIEEAQTTTAAELIPRKNVSKVAGSVRQRLNAGMADTYAFGEYAGEGARQIVDMLSEANEKRIRQIRTATEFSKNLLKDTGFQDWKKEEQTFKTENGKEYTMTVPQMMELYLLNKREQARLHIYGKGIRVEDKKGKFTEAFTVTESDVQQVTDYLKQNYPEAVRVADELQKFGATVLTDWGNEASNLMWGISKFTEPNYWQIRSDKSYMKADEKMEQDAPERASMNRLMNLGRTKAVDPKANNEILIGDVFDTFLQTVDDMTSYSSILPAVSDALRWFNSVVELEDGSKIRIRKLMENKLGTDMVKVFTESIKALNGGISHGNNSLEGLVGKLMGNAKAAAVAGNLRVVFQQPTAYTRAYSVMEAKYLNKALLMKPAVKEMQEHSAIGWWKGQGFYSNGLAPSLRKLILDDASVSEKITEKTLILAGLADDLTWGTLWNAAKLKVEDTMKNLEKGSPEYFKAIEKVHSDVINKTQVVDTPLTKALWMRGGGAGKSIVALYTAFMNEPMKTYSMVSTALDKALRGEEGGKKALGIAIVAFGLNAVVNAMAQSIADAARDDDLDKNYWEKYIEKWKSNAFDNVNPLTYIPVIKEAWSITQGFQNNRLDLQALQNSWNALNELTRIAQHKSTKTPFGQVETVAKAVSSWTGIPFTNVMRTFNSIGNLTGWDFLRRKEYTNAQLARNIVVSVEEGDMEDYQKYSEKLLKAVKGDEKKYTSYVSDYLAENSLVIEDYAERYLDDPTVMNDALEELGQYFSDDIIMKAVRKYARSTSEEDIVGTTPLANGNSVYTSKDLNRMLEKGDIATAQEIIDNINAGYAKTGSNTTAKNAVTDYWKPKYLAATGSERDAIAKMLYKLKNKGKQMYSSKDLQKWVSDANKKK